MASYQMVPALRRQPNEQDQAYIVRLYRMLKSFRTREEADAKFSCDETIHFQQLRNFAAVFHGECRVPLGEAVNMTEADFAVCYARSSDFFRKKNATLANTDLPGERRRTMRRRGGYGSAPGTHWTP